MIALVRGEVAVRRGDHVVLVAGGVGYRLAVSAETLRHVPAVGRTATLYSHLVVRDDALAIAICHVNGAPHAAAVAESRVRPANREREQLAGFRGRA